MSCSEDYDVVFIEGLSLLMSIGIYEAEKAAPQRVLVDMRVKTLPNAAHVSDDISEALSYEDMATMVRHLAHQRHYDLVETFAEAIADSILQLQSACSVRVSVRKPDIFDDIDAVGITIERSKD